MRNVVQDQGPCAYYRDSQMRTSCAIHLHLSPRVMNAECWLSRMGWKVTLSVRKVRGKCTLSCTSVCVRLPLNLILSRTPHSNVCAEWNPWSIIKLKIKWSSVRRSHGGGIMCSTDQFRGCDDILLGQHVNMFCEFVIPLLSHFAHLPTHCLAALI